MGKTAYVSVTYLYSFDCSLLDLEDDTSDDKVYEKIEELMEEETSRIANVAKIYPNDVEITIN